MSLKFSRQILCGLFIAGVASIAAPVFAADPSVSAQPPQHDVPPLNDSVADVPAHSGQNRAALNTNDKSAADTSEKKIAAKMHLVNAKEIKMGRLAQKRSDSQEVKDYGKMLVADHTKADNELKAAAKRDGIALTPPKFEAKDVKMEQHMRSLSSAQFDKEFLEHMRDGHHEVVSELKGAEAELPDCQVKALIKKQLPTIESHETKAIECLNSLNS